MNFIETVAEEKKKEIEIAKNNLPLSRIMNKLGGSDMSFKKAISGSGKFPSLIAEIKIASPSKGLLKKDFDIAKIAKAYGSYADAVSVLTDEKFFRGKKEYPAIARKNSGLPVLMKDFIIDKYQIYESRYLGADAILLISEMLSKDEINYFLRIAKSLGMDCLVEAGSSRALKKVLGTDAEIIGINNRDLASLEIRQGNVENLLKLIPKKKMRKLVIVAESSISSRRDVEKLKGKVDAVLVGTALMEAKNLEAKLKELKGKPLVKICGITNENDAFDAIKAGADILGFNFYEKSRRFITTKKALAIIRKLPKETLVAGIFVNPKSAKQVNKTAEKLRLDFVQLHGDESPAFCGRIERAAIKAIRVKDEKSIKEAEKYKTKYILLDSFGKSAYGGTGEEIKFRVKKLPEGKLVFLSGGINPENAAGKIKLNPFALDVCSGVEKEKGKKDFGKMRKLIRAVKGACG